MTASNHFAESKRIRIAFASTNGKNVDRQFGAAERFYIWDVGTDSAATVETVAPCSECDKRDDRMAARAHLLDGCAIVYSTQISVPAAAKLAKRHVYPMRVEPSTPIGDAIHALQTVLQGNPPPWLRKAAGVGINGDPIGDSSFSE